MSKLKSVKAIISSVALAFASLLLSVTADAKSIWVDNSLSYLEGSNYKVGAQERSVFTFEHASGHTWGDVFFFVDRTSSEDGTNETYMEFSPRLSLGKLPGSKPIDFGPISDLLLTATVESNESQNSSFNHTLVGGAIDFDIPGFDYFQLNLYRRHNEAAQNNWQVTTVWGLPFKMLGQNILLDGFIDWRDSNRDYASDINATTQLKLDVGNIMFQLPYTIYVGVEHTYWKNKYGIKSSKALDTNEENLNFLVKVHF